MTNLGIFGDSFAHAYAPHIRNQAWMFHLPGYDPTIYALCGSSLFYSYQKFLDNHHKHEKNIFCVTDSRRWPENVITDKYGQENGLPTFQSVDSFLKKKRLSDDEKEETIKRIEILKDLYFYFDNDFLFTFQNLIIKHIKEIRPDTLIISCFWEKDTKRNIIINSAGDNSVVLQTYTFIMLSSIIEKKPYIPFVAGQTYTEADLQRHTPFWDILARNEKNLICHLSEEMNQILAKDMLTALETGVWNPSPPSYVPHQKNIPFYYG